jgi:nicotinamide mononucleotide transporter
MSSYFWGIIGAILYGSFAFAFGYVGDAQLFVFVFLPAQFVGIHIWSKQLDNQATTRVKSLTFSNWCLTLFLSFILIILFYYEIPIFSKYLTSEYLFETRFIPHILDAITNGLSVIGEVLLIACYWEQYIIWTFVNLMLIIMYSGKSILFFSSLPESFVFFLKGFFGTTRDINLLIVWIMLTCNSSCGLYTWYHRWKNRKMSSSTINKKDLITSNFL